MKSGVIHIVFLSSNLQRTGSKLESLEAELAEKQQHLQMANNFPNDNESRKLFLTEEKKELAAEIAALREKDIEIKRAAMSIQEKRILSDQLIYRGAAILILIIALLSATYRIHLREISKNEQIKLGFHRIRIAANNAHSPGFDSEVRSALTQDAFTVHSEEKSLFTKKIESPLPGLPSSDLATTVINRILDEVDIVVTPKNERVTIRKHESR